MGSVEFTTTDLGFVASWLKGTDRKAANAMKARVREAGGIAAEAVRQEAQADGMVKAAGAVSVRGSYVLRNASVRVVVSASKAPNARPLNSGSRGSSGFNRHPVYGNLKIWVNQPVRPFFDRGIATAAPVVAVAIDKIITDITGSF